MPELKNINICMDAVFSCVKNSWQFALLDKDKKSGTQKDVCEAIGNLGKVPNVTWEDDNKQNIIISLNGKPAYKIPFEWFLPTTDGTDMVMRWHGTDLFVFVTPSTAKVCELSYTGDVDDYEFDANKQFRTKPEKNYKGPLTSSNECDLTKRTCGADKMF